MRKYLYASDVGHAMNSRSCRREGGYSPNTAYQESQYGSGFDDDAEWNNENWR